MREKLKEIAQLRQEQSILLRTLEMWADVQSAGIDPESVSSFGWERDESAIRDFRSLRRFPDKPWIGPWLMKSGKPEWYNFVRLNDGTKVKLPRPIQAPEFRQEKHQ